MLLSTNCILELYKQKDSETFNVYKFLHRTFMEQASTFHKHKRDKRIYIFCSQNKMDEYSRVLSKESYLKQETKYTFVDDCGYAMFKIVIKPTSYIRMICGDSYDYAILDGKKLNDLNSTENASLLSHIRYCRINNILEI